MVCRYVECLQITTLILLNNIKKQTLNNLSIIHIIYIRNTFINYNFK